MIRQILYYEWSLKVILNVSLTFKIFKMNKALNQNYIAEI